jgi:hypothetical protein
MVSLKDAIGGIGLSIINRVSFSFSSYFPFTNNHAVDRRARVGASLFYGDWQNWNRWLFCPVHIAPKIH